jgi:hypothetical protein
VLEFRLQGGQVNGCALLYSQGHPHRRRDTDSRRSPDYHGFYGIRHLLVVAGEDIGFLQRQSRLIEESNSGFRPFERRNHCGYQCKSFRGKVHKWIGQRLLVRLSSNVLRLTARLYTPPPFVKSCLMAKFFLEIVTNGCYL